MKTLAALRAYLAQHPTYVVAAGLALVAAGNAIAGRQDAAMSSIAEAAAVLGVRAFAGPGAAK